MIKYKNLLLLCMDIFVFDSFICVIRLYQLQIAGQKSLTYKKRLVKQFFYKDSSYPSHGVIEELAKLNNLDGATNNGSNSR